MRRGFGGKTGRCKPGATVVWGPDSVEAEGGEPALIQTAAMQGVSGPASDEMATMGTRARESCRAVSVATDGTTEMGAESLGPENDGKSFR